MEGGTVGCFQVYRLRCLFFAVFFQSGVPRFGFRFGQSFGGCFLFSLSFSGRYFVRDCSSGAIGWLDCCGHSGSQPYGVGGYFRLSVRSFSFVFCFESIGAYFVVGDLGYPSCSIFALFLS